MKSRPAVRYIVAALVVLTAFWLSMFMASLVGWSFEPHGWHRVRDDWPLLLMSGVVAVVGVAVGRFIAGRAALSWWLLAGLLPPLYFGLSEGLGVL